MAPLYSSAIIVATFYQFVNLPDIADLRDLWRKHCQQQGLKGTVLLATEGVNGSIAGSRSAVESFLALLRSDQRLSNLAHKESLAKTMPFHRMKIKIKQEIVTMGVDGVDPIRLSGTHVDYLQWNALLADPDVLVIDPRNQYESRIGTFKHTVPVGIKNFREFPDYVRQKLNSEKHKKIAMFCTGGIRCEKATNFMLQEGFNEVYQLNGGILKYLQDIKPEDSLWQGECFVFDGRVAVDDALQHGHYQQCFACRVPLSEADINSPQYEEGIACPYCYANLTETQQARFSERQRQVTLAKQRKQKHIGANLDKR